SVDTLPNLSFSRIPCSSAMMRLAVPDARAAAVDSNGPVLDRQARHLSQIGVGRHDRAVAQRESDRRDLDVDLLHGAADALELGGQATVLERWFVVERPDPPGR